MLRNCGDRTTIHLQKKASICILAKLRPPFFTVLGMSGYVVLDERGDREPDYWITDMQSDGSFVIIAQVLNKDGYERVSFGGKNHLHYIYTFTPNNIIYADRI